MWLGYPRLAGAEKQNCFSPLPSEASGTDRFLALPPGPSRGPPGDRTEARPLSYGAAVGCRLAVPRVLIYFA